MKSVILGSTELLPEIAEPRRFFKSLEIRARNALVSTKEGENPILVAQLERILSSARTALVALIEPVQKRALEIDAGARIDLSHELDRKAVQLIETHFRKHRLHQELIWLYERAGRHVDAAIELAVGR